MESNAFAIACSEVDEIFKIMSQEELTKIPNKFKEFINKNKSNTYTATIDKNIPLYKQKLQQETVAICSLIYRSYLVSPEKRKELQEKDIEILKQLEKEAREKYNPDNIFKTNTKEVQDNEPSITENIETPKENLELVEYKEKNVILKFIEKIVSFFKRNKN